MLPDFFFSEANKYLFVEITILGFQCFIASHNYEISWWSTWSMLKDSPGGLLRADLKGEVELGIDT